MGALMIGLFEIGLKIAAAHAGGKVEEMATIPGLVRRMAVKLNDLSVSETGQPIDWSNIHEHEHLG